MNCCLDCLMVVDQNGTPQDLDTVLTNGDNNTTTGQTTFNKVRIDDNRFKLVFCRFVRSKLIFCPLFRVAIKCLDYPDKTLLTNSLAGSVALQLRLLNSLGYKCIPVGFARAQSLFGISFFQIHYDEFMKIQVPNDRIKYIQRKVKEAVSSSSKPADDQ